MSDTDLDISSLTGALKALITRNETELDAVIAKAQRLAAKRLKHNAHLRELSEKTEAAKEALDKLMLQTAEQERYHDQIRASVEALKERLIV